MKIYQAIREDHDIQRDLLKQLKSTSPTSSEGQELWKELKKELEVHEVAEERYFYSPLIDTDEMQEDARHGMAEHHEIDELIQEVDKSDKTSTEWMENLKKLEEKVLHHLKDEEEEFFEKAKGIYDSDEADSLADGYEATMKEYRAGWPDSIPGSDSEVE
ncbi:MAG: hemerythrin domain-containing protein [Weeksellaceae bacterium]